MPTADDLLISQTEGRSGKDRPPEYYPTEDEKRLVATVRRKYQEKDISKRAYEKTWFVNGSFIRGQHYIAWNDYTATFEIPYRVPPHRVRLVVNYILAFYRRTKARLTASKPGWFIRPASTDQEDVERSRAQLQALESEYERIAFHAVFKDFVGWLLECGSGLVNVRWNPWSGQALTEEQPQSDEMGQPVVDPETGQPAMERVPVTDESGRQLHEGENEIEIISPYEIQVDPMSTSMKDANWIVRSKIRSLEWIREQYPDKGQYVKPEQVQISAFYEKRLKQIVGIFGHTTESQHGESDSDAPKNSSVVHEYHEKRSEKHPKGRYVVVAGEVLLHDGPNPYNHGKFPFVKADEIRISGRFWGMATIEQMIPLQKNYNRARSQEVENRTLMGRPKILVPRSAKIRQSSFDAEAGERIDYNNGPRGEKPEMIAPPSTAQATQNELQHTLNDLQEVSSWHEVSRGILPSANIPGVGIEKLQMADETSLGDTGGNLDLALIEIGQLLLSNIAQFWNEERMVRAGGEGTRLEATKLRGSDLTGDDESKDYFDVRVIPHSTLMRDPSKQREKVKEMLEMGVLDPVAHREIILKMLDTGDIDQIFADDRLDEQWSSKENELMESGQFSQPQDFENHEVHLKVLNRYRKSERYRRLPPEIQKLFAVHGELHEQLGVAMAAKKAMAQAEVAGMLQPPPSGAGGGGGSQQPEGKGND